MQPHALSLRGSQSSPSPPRTDGRGSLSDPGGSEVDMMIQAASTSTRSGGVRWPAPEEISALGDPGSTSRDEDSLLSRRAAFASTDSSCGEENPTLVERTHSGTLNLHAADEGCLGKPRVKSIRPYLLSYKS